jgi:HPt (histidine-containing phosphotransfer) domain-containing protein
MEARDQLRALPERGCASLKDQVESVGSLLSGCAMRGDGTTNSIAETQAITHQIKGTGGSIGYMELANAATALDDHLKRLAKSAPIDPLQLQIAKELFARLQERAGELSCEKSALYNLDLSALSRT